MSDDITFCGSECNNKKCFRHPSNIAEPNIPHSFAYLKDTDMCLMKKQEIRLIDAEALKEVFNGYHSGTGSQPKFTLGACLQLIDNAPTVEVRPQGEWKLDDTEQFCYCSNCEDTYYPRPLDPSWYYCPHCGADMRKGGAE